MNSSKCRVSIGLPVFNGEKYLEEALDSLLTQTFCDFELIISDNASTDRTQRICKAYARKDERIRYYRNQTNIGVNPNFNQVFNLSSGDYFKWAAHDDIYIPEYIEQCVRILDTEPSVVLCHSKTKLIDEHSQIIGPIEFEVNTTSNVPYKRFYSMIHVDHWCFQIFGVVRSSALKGTRKLGPHHGSDRVLLAEISLLGKIYEVPDYLFLRRDHLLTSWQIVCAGTNQDMVSYFPVNTKKQIQFRGLHNFYGYFNAVNRTQLFWKERLMCYLQLLRLIIEKSINRLIKVIKRVVSCFSEYLCHNDDA